MPKNQRFVLAQQIQNKMLDMATGVIEANKARDKVAFIDRLDTQLDQLRFLIRVAHQLSLINSQHYEQMAQRMVEIGKMIGGWQRRIKIADVQSTLNSWRAMSKWGNCRTIERKIIRILNQNVGGD